MKSALSAIIAAAALCPVAAGEPFVGPPMPPGLAVPDHDSTTTPISDREETGALTDLLPGRVELMALPEGEPGMGDASQSDRLSLFPPAIWPELPGEPLHFPEPGSGGAFSDSPSGELSPAEIAAISFKASPPPALNDPQKLLPASQAAQLKSLLEESLGARGSFQICITLLKASQQIPADLNPPELLRRWFGRTKSLLVIYYPGKPERTQAFFSPETLEHHSSDDLRQVVDFGVREAARMTPPVAQLQRFCYKTAIRLDRLHRQGVVSPGDDLPVPAVVPVAPSRSLWWAFAVGVQATALAAGAFWWWHRRRQPAGFAAGQPVFLPGQETIPRLGAPHSSGFGATIHFGAEAPRL